MPLVYALVSHGTIVLAEYSASSGNFTQVAHELLEKIPIERDTRMTYNAEHHTFNYLVRNEVVYLCLADKDFGQSIPFAFLEKIATQFEAQFGRRARETSVPYSMNADFAPVLQRQLEAFSNDRDKMRDVQQDLDRVKGVMQENISLVLEGSEKLEHLVVQSEGLMDTSTSFRTGATRLKQQMWWNDIKVKALIVGICFFLLIIVVANACGGMSFPECSL